MTLGSRGIVLREMDRLFRDGTLSGLGDAQLLERYLTRRDESAFEALVDRHGPMVLGLCRRMLHDSRDVEDAFQATFLVLVRRAPAIRDRGLLSNWLYGVALRVASRARGNVLRRRGREIALANLEPPCSGEATDLREIAPVLDQELNRLPAKYRAALVLCYLNGRTHDQAAEALSCPVGTVRSRLARGRDLLRRRLTNRGYAPGAALLAEGANLPAQLLTEAVPPSLASATVKTVLGFGTFKTLHAAASAASVVALTEGVLMTMKLAQLKWIGLGVLAVGFSASGVAAVSYRATAAQQAGIATSTVGAPGAPVPEAGPQDTGPPNNQRFGPAERLEALERKVDELLRRLGGATATTASTVVARVPATASRASVQDTARTATAPSASVSAATSSALRPTRPSVDVELEWPRQNSLSLGSLRTLEVRLKLAVEDLERSERHYKDGRISDGVLAEARGKLELTKAELEGLSEEIEEELGRLKLEILKKRAEKEAADAENDAAEAVLARTKGLRERNVVAEGEVLTAQAKASAARARVKITMAEMEIVTLRMEHLAQRLERIKKIIAWAGHSREAPR
jgi:RNA polymerase sigma factor (sigma-70 family)